MTTTIGRSSIVTIRGRTAILVIVLISYFMILLDNSIIFTGLPQVQKDLGFSTVGLSWVQSAYTLVFGGLLLLGARSGDILGRRRMFVIGLLIFAAASLAISLAPTAAWLVSARAVQGIGSAILAPTTLSLLTANFPEGRERTKAIAAYGAVAGIGASLGLVLGGVFADLLSWRVGFFVNVPIGIAMAVATVRWIPETHRVPGRFDLIGALGSTLGMTALVYGILRSATHGWTDPITLASFAFGAGLLVLLVVNEARVRQPIMPLRLFADRRRAGAYLTRLLYLAAMLPFFYFTTQFLQGVLGYNPLQAGLAFLPMTLVNFVVAMAIPRLTARFGNTALLAAGVIFTFVGMAWLSRLGVNSSYLTAVALPMVLIGIGQGLAFAPMTSAGISGVAPSDAGAASGMVSVAHQFGGSLGIGILTAVAAGTSTAALGARNTMTAQVSVALTGAAVSLAAAVLVCVVMITRRAKASTPAAPPTTTHPINEKRPS